MPAFVFMHKAELLAPAGSLEALYGAFNAGADAVYFGTNDWSARAYAKNIDTAGVIDAVRYARLIGKKTYLTVNTLMKEGQCFEACDQLELFAADGLSGVIVQDLGMLKWIRENFPALKVLASTQMAVTGVYGARLLKERGVSRVVPARELTLPELSAIRREADIEVEAFVHGAMCYSYSGMCLFSAMVGGRSGNRGRCAQACRMPYNDGKYLLSMKDMCTAGHIPALIRAGIDSFKIEGRMKHPAYAAGVTAVYRKYIDRYYGDPSAYGDMMEIDGEDLELLRSLYLRSEISDGYLERRKGREMITVESPAYKATEEALLDGITRKYLTGKKKFKADMHCVLRAGEEASLTLTCGDVSVTVTEGMVQEAKKQPLSKERVKEILSQLGETSFTAGEVDVATDGASFVPVGGLKTLRREGIWRLENALIGGTGHDG